MTRGPAALDELRTLLAELRANPHVVQRGYQNALLERVLEWLGLHSQERAFLRHLAEDRLSYTADVFADWLSENGRDAEGRRVRLLRPREGDVLAVNVPEGAFHTGPGSYARQMLEALQDRLPGGTLVVLLAPDADLRALDPGQMRAAGWVRAEPSPRPSGCARCGSPDLTFREYGAGWGAWHCSRCGLAWPAPPLPADAPPR